MSGVANQPFDDYSLIVTRNTEPPTLDQVLASNLHRIRLSMRMSQDQVARRAREQGLSWSRSSVAAIENGHKSMVIGELVLLKLALGVPMQDLLAGDGVIRLGDGALRTLEEVRAILAGDTSAVQAVEELPEYTYINLRRYLDWQKGGRSGKADRDRKFQLVALAGNGEAEQKAARKLCVPADVLSAMAFQRWGRSLTDERDAQVELAEHDLDSPQSVRAFRGRITRQLLAELEMSIAFYFDYIGVS
jgi:transcriptional regulator with XRE-family HTH domain